MPQIRKIAVILAGGKGTRLWPLSRQNYPKQFIEFKDGFSLFQLTLKRTLSYFRIRHIYIISSENYRFTIFNQIEFLRGISTAQKNILKNNLIAEPQAKNTLVAALLALRYLETNNAISKKDILYIFPSDHIISPLYKFKAYLKKAQRLAALGLMVVFGIPPKFPREGYGYILPKGRISVERFAEKPSFAKAKKLINKGAFWNSGIFCFKKDIFWEELSKFRPGIYKYRKLSFEKLLRDFSNIPSDSIDYAIVQNSHRVGFVKSALNWSDLGSWDSFAAFYSKIRNDRGNLNIGRAQFLDCRNCFIYSKSRLISLVGLKDLLVIDSPDSLLIVKKDFSDKVKQLVEILNRTDPSVTKDSLTVYRPWGYYTILEERRGYKVKEIGVYPKRYICLQRHRFRSEHWNVVEGRAQITVGRKKLDIRRNEGIFVPRGITHRVYNPANKILKIIEVQIGNYLSEDDIKRFDSY
jgi:mannose-1-phosphate guanylyltransferase/mannose-6-phosphate isomerase